MRARTRGSSISGSDGIGVCAAALIVGLVGMGVSLAPLHAANAAERPTPSKTGAQPAIEPLPTSEWMRAQLEGMPETEVKAFYARCSDASIGRRLDGGEAMACSIGYEVLLQKHFGGDFERFLAWSRGQSR